MALRRPLETWFEWRFEGLERIPSDGPLLVAANHISFLDPMAVGLMLNVAGRRARFLAKAELFEHRLLRPLLVGSGQIPVERGSGSHSPLDAAHRALKAGEAIVIYPEATLTFDPDHLPMRAKTGIARLALLAEVPVLPIAVWGTQAIWGRGGTRTFGWGRPIWMSVGVPMDLSRYEDRQDDVEAHREIADLITGRHRAMVTEMRRTYPFAKYRRF